jgi:hypothetical protein
METILIILSCLVGGLIYWCHTLNKKIDELYNLLDIHNTVLKNQCNAQAHASDNFEQLLHMLDIPTISIDDVTKH